MKPDKDCSVFKLGANEYYLCRSKNPHEGNCPYIRDYFLEKLLCYHPDKHEFPKGLGKNLHIHEI
jgi:hypothetical protein